MDRLSVAGLLESLLTKAVLRGEKKRPVAEPLAGEFLLGYRQPKTIGEPVSLSHEDRSKHLYILGSTGAGKSNLLVRLIEDDFNRGKSAIVLDLRGDLIDRLLARFSSREDAPDRIRLVDLRQDALIFPFNPLLGDGEYTSRALHVLAVIKQQAESWGVQLDETLRHSLLALSEANGTLLDIEPLLTDAGFRTEVLSRVRDAYVQSFFNRYTGMSADRQQSWSLPVLNKISAFWTIPLLRQMLAAERSVNWAEWLDKPGSLVCVALAAHRLQSTAHLIGGLLVSSVQNAIMARADLPEKARNPVTLYVDEFETMASPAFNTLIAEGRRFRASLVLAHQNLAQVEPILRQTIRNNVQTQVIFQCGSPDAAELASEVSTNDSRDTIRRNLVRQRVGEAYLVRRGQLTLPVATLHSPDPRISGRSVQQLRSKLLQRTCVLAVNGSVRTTKSIQEVRHVRRPKV